jgi:hypothetical protein
MLRRTRELQGPETVLNQPILDGINPDLLHLFTRNMTTLPTAQNVAPLPGMRCDLNVCLCLFILFLI